MILGTEPSGSKEKDSWLGIAVVSPESRIDNPVVADGFNNRKPVVSIQVVSIRTKAVKLDKIFDHFK